MGIIELLVVILLLLTEFGNVAANFWTTNVFAGAWCGIIILIHCVLVFSSGIKQIFLLFNMKCFVVIVL